MVAGSPSSSNPTGGSGAAQFLPANYMVGDTLFPWDYTVPTPTPQPPTVFAPSGFPFPMLGPPPINEWLMGGQGEAATGQAEGGPAGQGGGQGGGGGSSCCFVAGTLVAMADGATQKIEHVERGDKVRGENGQLNTVVGFNRPLLQQRPLVAFNDSKPFTTWDHPFWDNETGVWRCVSPQHRKNTASLIILPLEMGDKITTVEGDVEIAVIEKVAADPETQLYDLRLDGDHTYVADGYIVHNCH